MEGTAQGYLAALLKGAAFLFVLNEARGFILAAPILYGMYQAGGSIMAIWIGFCSLAGVALSVIVPLVAANRLRAMIRPIAVAD